MSQRTVRIFMGVFVLACLALGATWLAGRAPLAGGQTGAAAEYRSGPILSSAPFNPMWARVYWRQNSAQDYSLEGGEGLAVIPTGDRGLIVAGYQGPGTPHGDTYQYPRVIEVRPSGNIDWGISLVGVPGVSFDAIESIVPTDDGGYLAVGSLGNGLDSRGDMAVVELSRSGTVRWVKSYGERHNGRGRAVQGTADGGFVVVGDTGYFGTKEEDGRILKLSSSGRLIWQTAIGGPGRDYLYSVQVVPDGSFLVVGTIVGASDPTSQAWLMQVSPTGLGLRSLVYGDDSHTANTARSICSAGDGGYVVVGSQGQHPASGDYADDIWVWKIDIAGNIIWQKRYVAEGRSWGSCVFSTHDGGFVVLGEEEVDQNNALILRLSSSGGLQLAKRIFGCRLNAGFESDSGNLVLTGRLDQKPGILVVSLGPDGKISSPCPLVWGTNIAVQATSASAKSVSLAARRVEASSITPSYSKLRPAYSIQTICSRMP